jgi:exopolyphosphatase / guanosine-5'-triphosphate,3'-diphosphate pyrophosphatase
MGGRSSGDGAVTTVTMRIDEQSTVVDVAGNQHTIPLGAVSLGATELSSDPPRPEELTNAIGAVIDHLDDMIRALPLVTNAERVHVVGDLAGVIAAVEYGGEPPLPFALSRSAAEDVFRTVATEPAAIRALNPGLPADCVDTIVAACCIVVASMRHLHLDEITMGPS